MRNCYLLFMASFLVFNAGLPVSAATLFEENWDSGTIDPGKWTQGTLGQASPVRYNGLACMNLLDENAVPGSNDQTPCTSGDFGWISGSATFNTFDTWIRSVEGFPRGDNLVIEFTTIGARHRPGTGLPFPGNSGLNGPGHNTNDGATPIGDDCEAGICGTYGTMTWGDGAGSANGTTLGDDWNHDPYSGNLARWWNQLDFSMGVTPADHKIERALRHRVHVGNTSGFFYEYKRMDEVDWQVAHNNNGTIGNIADDVPMDTRETAAGGNSPTIYLGWCTNQGAVIIDDIVVYTEGAPPAPPNQINNDRWIYYN